MIIPRTKFSHQLLAALIGLVTSRLITGYFVPDGSGRFGLYLAVSAGTFILVFEAVLYGLRWWTRRQGG